MGSTFSVLTMKVLVVLSAAVACALGAPKVSLQAISTPLSRGGGRIVGGSDAYHGEFPHQIALLRGGVGGSLMPEGPSWLKTGSSLLDIAATDNLPLVLESVLEARTCMMKMKTRLTSLSPK